MHHAQMNLLPSHTYSNNSGGDPLCIPDLTVSACRIVNLFFASKLAQCMTQAVDDGDIYSKLFILIKNQSINQ